MQLFVSDRRLDPRSNKEACSLFILDKGLPSATAGRKAWQPHSIGLGLAKLPKGCWLFSGELIVGKPQQTQNEG
jgi:hypothetical protein